jgi:hypothetical protein
MDISKFINNSEIYIIYVVFDAGFKNLRIIKKFPLERAREQSPGAVWARLFRPSFHENNCLFLKSILTGSKILTSVSFFVLITRSYLHWFFNSRSKS